MTKKTKSKDDKVANSLDGFFSNIINIFMVEGPYQIETTELICSGSQWIGLYMIGISVIKEFFL